MRAAVFVGVHLYRVAPSLYNPIPGLVWWVLSKHFCYPPVLPCGWGAESMSLSVSEFSSLHRAGGSQLLISHGGLRTKPKPLILSPVFLHPSMSVWRHCCLCLIELNQENVIAADSKYFEVAVNLIKKITVN